MLSLGLELGLPLSGCFYSLGNDCKGPRAIARVLDAGEVRQGLAKRQLNRFDFGIAGSQRRHKIDFR